MLLERIQNAELELFRSINVVDTSKSVKKQKDALSPSSQFEEMRRLSMSLPPANFNAEEFVAKMETESGGDDSDDDASDDDGTIENVADETIKGDSPSGEPPPDVAEASGHHVKENLPPPSPLLPQ
jgi:hypothetical protein